MNLFIKWNSFMHGSARAGGHAGTSARADSILKTFCILISLIALAAPVLADSLRSLVAKGNRSLEGGDYDKALELYEKASVRAPESPVVTFNTGSAYYRREEFMKARELFEQAALKAEDLSIEAGAWYNMNPPGISLISAPGLPATRMKFSA